MFIVLQPFEGLEELAVKGETLHNINGYLYDNFGALICKVGSENYKLYIDEIKVKRSR